jgi:hypothetical protein
VVLVAVFVLKAGEGLGRLNEWKGVNGRVGRGKEEEGKQERRKRRSAKSKGKRRKGEKVPSM